MMNATKNTERNDKVQAARDALDAGLAALQSGDDWKRMLEGIAKNARARLSPRRLSFNNQLIVMASAYIHNMDGSCVATFKGWQKVGRTVKRGQKSVCSILAPRQFSRNVERPDGSTERVNGMFFRALPVFFVDQTEGEPLPPPPEMPRGEMPNDIAGFDQHLARLSEVALTIEGKPVSKLSVRERRDGDPQGAAGWYVPSTREIVVMRTDNQAAMFKVLVHEVAHSLMHATVHHSYAWQEVEAESVAYIVSNVFGLDTSGYSFPYVATWATADKTERNALSIVAKSGKRIVDAVNVILDALLDECADVESEIE